jgi:hypothetical protein
MSDRDDLIAARTARDERFAALQLSIDVQNELRAGKGLAIIMEAFRQEADECLTAFSEISPANINEISFLQSRVRMFNVAFRALDTIMRRGAVAEASLRAEDEPPEDERID